MLADEYPGDVFGFLVQPHQPGGDFGGGREICARFLPVGEARWSGGGITGGWSNDATGALVRRGAARGSAGAGGSGKPKAIPTMSVASYRCWPQQRTAEAITALAEWRRDAGRGRI